MNSSVLLIVVSTLIVIGGTLVISNLILKKQKATDEDWAIGGRNLPIYVVVGTQFATAMGGGVLVGHVGTGYSAGWSTLSYGLLVTIPFFILTLIAPWLRKNNFTTVPEIILKVSGYSKTLALLSAFMTILVPFGWICTQLVAFAKLYTELTGISMTVLIIAMGLISMAFVMPSGLKTVAWTDFIFSIFMVIIAAASVVFAFKLGGGVSNVFANAPDGMAEFPKGMLHIGLPTIFLWIFSIMPGSLTNQMYYQRICAIDKVENVKKSLFISAIVIFATTIWSGIMGITIRTLNNNLEPEMATGWFLTQVPQWFLAIFAGLVVATIMSTISSAVQSVVVNITSDIYKKTINPEATNEKLTSLSRILTIIVVIVAVILSIAFPQALNWLVATYAYSAAALLAPIFGGYIFKDKNFITVEGAIASIISGILGCMIGSLIKTPIPYVAWGILLSSIMLVVVSKLTNKKIAVEK